MSKMAMPYFFFSVFDRKVVQYAIPICDFLRMRLCIVYFLYGILLETWIGDENVIYHTFVYRNIQIDILGVQYTHIQVIHDHITLHSTPCDIIIEYKENWLIFLCSNFFNKFSCIHVQFWTFKVTFYVVSE